MRTCLGTIAFCSVLMASQSARADLIPGHLLVADSNTGVGRLISVDPATGIQTLITSGGFLQRPSGIAFSPSGDVIVTDRSAHAVISVNRHTGTQTLIASNGLLLDPVNVVIASNGDLIISDSDAFGGPGGVIRINPSNQNQAPISSGGNFKVVLGLVKESAGTLIVGDRGPQAIGADGLVIRITPDTGSQSILSQGGLLWNPDHLAVHPNGDIYVADHDGPNGNGGVFRIDPLTGSQTSLSVNGFFAGGPSGIAISEDGLIFVSDHNAFGGNGGIIQVNPITGQQVMISSGGFFVDPGSLAIIPVPEPLSASFIGIGIASLLLRRKR